MLAKELLDPRSIVVIGASNDITKPGGKILWNIIDGGFKGDIYTSNPKEDIIQDKKCYKNVSDLPQVDLAVIAIAAKYTLETVKTLVNEKGTKGFIIISAGYSETGDEGRKLEEEIVKVIESVGGSLIGPNCIGMFTTKYRGVFAGLTPKLDPKGVDFVSASGATACFILETAVPAGITFNSLFSVGNSAQIGVEEILEYWDETFDINTSSTTKMIYIENVDNPTKLLKHASSLVNKGCRIAGVKAGRTDAGNRAVSSHTGALAGSDMAVDALFKKAGIVRCFSREELAYVTGVMQYKELKGKNIAVITHAGGPGVMLTDTLSEFDMEVPHITGNAADDLMKELFPGSAVGNPIDFLATGTAEQLGTILDYVDDKFDNIDGSVVIFGTPGIFDVTPVYELLDKKIKTSKKPIFPCLPSPVLAKDAVETFKSLGRSYMEDEVALGKALAKVYHTPKPDMNITLPEIDVKTIREVIGSSLEGYLSQSAIQQLFKAAGIPLAEQIIVTSEEKAVEIGEAFDYPLVMKVEGPLHKSDVGGVSLHINDIESVRREYKRLMTIPGANGVLMQTMVFGQEVFIGASAEDKYGHIVLFGLGGIFIEVFKDVAAVLAPASKAEVLREIEKLQSIEIFNGARGQEGVNKDIFADIVVRVSALLKAAPEIKEMDLNPLFGTEEKIVAVDARIRIEKEFKEDYFVDDSYVELSKST